MEWKLIFVRIFSWNNLFMAITGIAENLQKRVGIIFHLKFCCFYSKK